MPRRRRFAPAQFIGEPIGRDTLNAVGLSAAVLAQRDPEAVIGVFTADHLIEPVGEFQRIVAQGFELVERLPHSLVTFGIAPAGPATGYGYLELGPPIDASARLVQRFREKPPPATAEDYFRQGPDRYLWNSGMFVWRADTLLGLHPPLRAGRVGRADGRGAGRGTRPSGTRCSIGSTRR